MALPSYEELVGESLPSYDELTGDETFKQWKERYAPRDSGDDYDFRAAFNAGIKPDPITGHWPDTFKKPNHPTFSNESIYAKGENANKAGRWDGDKFIPPTALPSYDELVKEPPDWKDKLAKGIVNTVTGLVPHSLADVPDFVGNLSTPVYGAVEDVKKAYGTARDIIAGKSLEESTRANAPENLRLADAMKTPPGSQERYDAGLETVAQMLMAAGIVHGTKAKPKPTVLKSFEELPLDLTEPKVVEPVKTTQEMAEREAPETEAVEASKVVTPAQVPRRTLTSPEPFPEQSQVLPQPENTILRETGQAPVATRPLDTNPVVTTETPVRDTQTALSVRARDEEQSASQVPPKAKSFIPSTEWQEVPDGTVLPNGGEYRFDQSTGKNWARWSEENLPKADTHQAPIAESNTLSGQPPESRPVVERQESNTVPQPESTTVGETEQAQSDLGKPGDVSRPRDVQGQTELNETSTKTSKIGQSIEAKAVEAKLTKGFEGTANFDPITIQGQANRATSLIKTSLEGARAVIRGDAPLPEGLRGTSLITAMEEHILKQPSAELAYELANSPLTSATSVAAQEMRLMAERVPDGITAKFQEIREARKAGSKQRGESTEKVAQNIQSEIARQASKRPTWEAFVREIECAA